MPDEDAIKLHAAHMRELMIHAVIYIIVFGILGAIAYFMQDWRWFITAAAGWGMVIIAQAAYVFIVERRKIGNEGDAASMQKIAKGP